MPEFKGTVQAIENWERIPQRLVQLGLAELVKDTNKTDKPIFPQAVSSEYHVKVYHVFVGSELSQKRVNLRFHYDNRPKARSCHDSSFTISDAGLSLILHSMTAMDAMNKLNIKLTGNGGLDFDKLEKVMEEAVVLVEERKKKAAAQKTKALGSTIMML